MQTCPFCNFDAGDRPLHEGRCPQCGSIVQWSDKDIAATLAGYKPVTTDDEPSSPVGSSFGNRDAASNDNSSNDTANYNAADDVRSTLMPQDYISDVQPVEPTIEPASSSSSAWSREDDAHYANNQSDDGQVPSPGDDQPIDKSTPALLSHLWKDSLSQSNDVRSTIKGQQGEQTVSDTVFSIQTREVRPVSDVPCDTLDYELLNIIGQGGVGVVYSARQASIDRNVALKMLRDEYRNLEDHRDKFLAEAVLTGELDHPNIVPIYDLGRSPSGELFYSMKNVVGTPWDRVITSKSLEENLDILLKVGDAIAFAHSRGVVHRDLKPENVMLGSYGEVLVMDWGIAVPTADFRKSASILRSQAMGGTPAYMAPEMAKGPIDAIGPASDVYLLGALLYEILTGYPPHTGGSVMECVSNAAKNIIRETSVTGELMEIAIKSMSTLPRRRYRKVQDFQAAIRLYQSHSESISLSDNAEVQLAEAIQLLDYQKFSQAVFAFQEALALWSENTPAQSGLSQAKLEYAKTALKKGDYDLGLSLLDPKDSEQQQLIDKLKIAIAERDARQNRLKTFRRIAAGLVGFIVIAGVITMFTFYQLYQNAEKNRVIAEQEKNTATLAKEKADLASKNALAEKKRAEDQTELAKTEKRAAELARHNTELARLESIAERRRAEESGYLAETGLIGASINQNSFAIAKSILQAQEQSASKSKLRHWEWGRFQYLVQGGNSTDQSAAVSTHTTGPTIECVDCSDDGALIAVGMGNGQCQLVNKRGDLLVEWSTGRSVIDLDFDHACQLLATCGLDDQRQPCVKVWQLRGNQKPLELKQDALDRLPTSISFSNETVKRWLVIGDDRNTCRVWDWQNDKDRMVLLGHNDAITYAKFSPDNRWIVSASLDGTVRVFNVETGKEIQRFSGHRRPVWCVAFSPDNKTIASAGEDQQILIWQLDSNSEASKQIDKVRREVAGQRESEAEFLTLSGHSGTVRDLNFTADGKRLVSAGNDNLIFLWQLDKLAESGNAAADTKRANVPAIKLRGHGGWVHSSLITSDGTQVVSGADDHTWRVWQVDAYREIVSIGQNNVAIDDASYTPDGKAILLAMADGTIQMWDRASGQLIETFAQGHDYLTNRAALTAGDRQLITAAGDNTLRVWDLRRGNQLRVLGHTGRNAMFGISRDAQWLIATGDEAGVGIWNLTNDETGDRYRAAAPVPVTTSKANRPPPFNEPTCVAITDDGKYFFVGDKDGRCEFWEREGNTKLASVAGHAESVVAAFALPLKNNQQAHTFITASADGTVAWWDAATGKQLSIDRLPHRAALHFAALSTDGRLLATAAMLGNGKGRLWLWDLASRTEVATYDTDGKTIQDMAFRRSGATDKVELLVTTADLKTSDKEIWAWLPQAKTLTPVNRPQWLSASVWGTLSSEDAESLIIFGGRGARLWRWADGKPVMQYRPASAVTALAVAGTGRLMASGNEDGSIVLWDLVSRKPTGTLLGVHQRAVKDLAFSPDGQRLGSVCQDGLMAVWSTDSGQPIAKRSIEKSMSVNAIAFSKDGRLLAVAAEDEVTRLHDAETLAQLHKLPGHAGPVLCVQFAPSGQWLATGGEDKSVRIYSTKTGKGLAVLLGHSAAVTSLDISGDGLRILSGSRDTSGKLWDATRVNQLLVADRAGTLTQGNASSEIGELLTLENHSADLVFVQFAPSGTEILTASKDGRAIVWPADRVPIALRLSRPAANHEIGTNKTILDTLAIISQPIEQDLREATLRVSILAEETNLSTSDLPADFHDEVAIDTSDGLFAWKDGVIQIAATNQVVANARQIGDGFEIKFSSDVTHEQAQQVVQHLNYEATSQEVSTVAQHSRTLKFVFLDTRGQLVSNQAETLIINLTDPRNSASLSAGKANHNPTR